MANSLAKQGELWDDLRVEKHFFHIFKHMLMRGTAGAMGPSAWLVYCMMKAHANHTTGEIFASQQTISDKCNLSVDSVQRAIKTLCEMGILEKSRVGRRNNYLILENIPITRVDEKLGAPVAVAQRTYVPQMFAEMIKQLGVFAASGNLPTDRNISINVHVNLVNQGDNSTFTINNISASPGGDTSETSEFVNAYDVIAERIRRIGC